MESTVICKVCGHTAATLARHLKASHGITADQYSSQFPGARIRSEACEANRRLALKKAHAEKSTKGTVKTVTCRCGIQHLVSRFDRTDVLCPSCRSEAEAEAEVQKWLGKSEPEDYVTCVGCGYRAENLCSHIQNTHPEWVRVYPGVKVSLRSKIRDKSTLKNRLHSKNGAFKTRHWGMDLTKQTRHRTIRIEKETLLKYAMYNGKIVVARAVVGLNHSSEVIRRECARHGLRTFRRGLQQDLCLDAVSRALGGVPFEKEWTYHQFYNKDTGYLYRYDGFFPSHRLIVEFHGYQHYVFPNRYMTDETTYQELRKRDNLKESLIRSDPSLRYFSLRDDEDYRNVEYVRQRLIREGILT